MSFRSHKLHFVTNHLTDFVNDDYIIYKLHKQMHQLKSTAERHTPTTTTTMTSEFDLDTREDFF